MAVGLVRDNERDDAALAGQKIRRQRLTLLEVLDRLASPPARQHDPVERIEDDNGLAALLDERSPACRVDVHASRRSNTRFAQRFRAAHDAQTHMFVNPLVHLDGRE